MGRAMLFVGAAAVVLAVFSGVYANDPWLAIETLPVPFGMIVYGVFSGEFPPLFDLSAITNRTRFEMYAKPGDVAIASCFKCGTTWTMNIVHQLRAWNNKTLAEGFEDITDVVPWPIQRPAPREGFQEMFDSLQKRKEWWDHESYPYRAFKLQVLPEGSNMKSMHKAQIPMRKDLRYIVVVRDPAEQIESGLHHFRNLAPRLSRWGMMEMPLFVMKKMLKMQGSAAYLQGWRDELAEPNVFLMHYADLKKDTETWLRRLARFLELDIPEDAWPLILRRVGLKSMRDNQDKYQYRLETEGGGKEKVVEFVRGHNKTHFLTRDEAVEYRNDLASTVDKDVFEYLVHGGDDLRNELIATAAAKRASP